MQPEDLEKLKTDVEALVRRYLEYKHIGPEYWQEEIERVLHSMGFREDCGVWKYTEQ